MELIDFDSPAAQRRRAVAGAVALTSGTSLAPQRYERYLLALYQRGWLTIEEVIEELNRSIYQVLYHSRATTRPSQAELQALLASSRRYNAAHQITGLLLYSEGRYVQVLEGAEVAVQALYARIQQDARHLYTRYLVGELSWPNVRHALNAAAHGRRSSCRTRPLSRSSTQGGSSAAERRASLDEDIA